MTNERFVYEQVGNGSRQTLILEAYLLLSLICLTTANLYGMYEESFGVGDLIYLILVMLWLSRFLIFRLLSTFDASTHMQPSIRGFFSLLCTTYLTGGGQIFDTITTTEDTDTESSLLPSFVLYLWQWFSVNVAVRNSSILMGSNVEKRNGHHRSLPDDEERGWYNTVSKNVSDLRTTIHLPTLQSLVPVLTALLLAWKSYAFLLDTKRDPKLYPVTMVQDKQPKEDEYAPFGNYSPKVRPSWSMISQCMIYVGTILSLLVFFRVMAPLPDLVAGSGNMASEGRQEKARRKKETTTTLSEQYFSIANENCVLLHAWSIGTRLVENLLLAGWLPRSVYVCRTAGHCSDTYSPTQLAPILAPLGVTSAWRRDGTLGSDVPTNLVSFLWIMGSVSLTTLMLLSALSIVSSRTHLRTVSFLLGGWSPVDEPTTSVPAWDARRKYKKGDLCAHENVMYEATIDAPQSKPQGKWLARLYEILRHEEGHLSTSRVLYYASLLQTGYSAMILVLFLVKAIVQKRLDVDLLIGALGTGVAAYALVGMGAKSMTGRSDAELLTLSHEIMGHQPRNQIN